MIRTEEQRESLKKNLQEKSIYEVMLFFADLPDTDWDGRSYAHDEIKRRILAKEGK